MMCVVVTDIYNRIDRNMNPADPSAWLTGCFSTAVSFPLYLCIYMQMITREKLSRRALAFLSLGIILTVAGHENCDDRIQSIV